ncbi:MAG: hypothetical protein JSS66_02920 [Armatimonadetes bacterium]|nr:hypothetical protein [Armatimonadota bacterium]
MKFRLLAAVPALLVTAVVQAAPDCLIVQLKVPLVEGEDRNVLLSPYLAEELDKDGRVRPVVWSLSDPVFREWTSRDVFGQFDASPSLRQALDTSRKLGLTYVIAVQAIRGEQNFVPVAELFVNGRSKWRFGPRDPRKGTDVVVSTEGRYDAKATKDLQTKLLNSLGQNGTFTVYVNNVPDWDATARAVAANWCTLLAEGPLKSLEASPRIEEHGTTPKEPTETHVDTAPPQDPVADAKSLLDQGKTAQALSVLRNACDAKPFDVVLRRALAQFLLNAGMPAEAGEAAQAASRLDPKDASLWLLCAEAWITAGDSEKASDAFKEAKARGAHDPYSERIEADLALLKGDADRAATLYAALGTPESRLRLAVAFGLAGKEKECAQALEQVPHEPVSEAEYVAMVMFIERAMVSASEDARNVLPTVRLHPGEPATLALARSLAARTGALKALVGGVVPPKRFARSHEARKLAHIMLAQSALQAQSFADNNDPDIADESAASLGQAMRLLANVRELYGLEQRYGASDKD